MNPIIINAAIVAAIIYFDSNKSLAKIIYINFQSAKNITPSIKNIALPLMP